MERHAEQDALPRPQDAQLGVRDDPDRSYLLGVDEEHGDTDEVEEEHEEAGKVCCGSPFVRATTRLDPRSVLSVDLSAVVLVYTINFLDALGGSISTPILPFYAREFHASYAEVGQLFSVFAIAQMGSMPFLSYLSDRYGRRKVLLAGTFGTAMGALWQGTATSYTSLLTSRVFSGTWSGVASVCQVYLVDVVPPGCRAEYISYLNSSTQASVLFGPSIGAGLSALGLSAPLVVQAGVSLVLFLIVWEHLPESPEWCRLHGPASPKVAEARTLTPLRKLSMGRRITVLIILGYGTLQFCGMVAQMAILSMFAVYAEKMYGLDSVHVGFTMTLGAISSVGTNIWLSPCVLRSMGENRASLLGFALLFVGSLLIAMQPFAVSVLGFMIAYQGLAINSSAVATGAANLTDSASRATIMTGARMLKSLGAVVGPIASGHLATLDVRLPFLAAAGFALAGFLAQVVMLPVSHYIQQLLQKRKTVGQETGLLEGRWVDEEGTPEEIWDLGLYVAELLSSRHYRWITYNEELKNFLSDSFPPVATESEEAHRKEYDRRRRLVREKTDLSYEELLKHFKEVADDNAELRQRLQETPGQRRSRTRSKGDALGWEHEGVKMERALSCQQMLPSISGFGGP